MSYEFDPNTKTLYLALRNVYPKVTPPREFTGNMFTEFERETNLENNGFSPPWQQLLEKWLPINAGLMRDPFDVNWEEFRIVDNRKYAFALLRWS